MEAQVFKQQTAELTYIGKYNCVNEYKKLKTCLSEHTFDNNQRVCETFYTEIGECITSRFRQMSEANSNDQAKNSKAKDGRNQAQQKSKSLGKGTAVAARKEEGNYPTATSLINSVILEYLLKYGFMKTIDSFQDEINSQQSHAQSNLVLDHTTGIAHLVKVKLICIVIMIQAFDFGKRDNFFTLWNKFVPMSLRQKDAICLKLEFYIHVYFTIFPVHPNNPKPTKDLNEFRKELKAFKEFLDTRGADQLKSSEFLEFYALPYVTNPVDHPIFSGLCTKKWANDLKQKMKIYLEENLPKIQTPQLYHWYINFKNSKSNGMSAKELNLYQPENEEMKERLMTLQKHYLVLQKKEEYSRTTLIESQSKWTKFSKEILNIAKELKISLESMGSQLTYNDISIQAINEKLYRFEAFLDNNQEELNKKYGIAIQGSNILQNLQQQTQQNKLQQQQQQQQHQVSKNTTIQDLAPLNFQRIRNFLMTSQDELKICATLQALRWRFTKAKNRNLIKQVLYLYMNYDILGCNPKDLNLDQSYQILDRLFQCSNKVLEYIMTFVNALASECLGRTYLLQKLDLVGILVRILFIEQEDTSLRQNALGTLQKFSLRRKPQTLMIQLDMIQWICNTLRNDRGDLSDYSIEYATALLMNLSLREAGKDKCENIQTELLQVLNSLIQHENLQVRTYVNGTLYSLFTRHPLKEEARKIGMPQALSIIMQNSDEQFKRQIQYILDQLSNNSEQQPPENDQDDDYDDDEEDDQDDDEAQDENFEDDEEEGEFNDIIDEQETLVGEDLLINEFMASKEEAQQQLQVIISVQQQNQQQNQQNNQNQSHITQRQQTSNDNQRPPFRPVTPIKSAQAMRKNQTPSNNNSTYQNYITQEDGEMPEEQQQKYFEETDRNLPSELKHRPKLRRTLYGQQKYKNTTHIKNQPNNENSDQNISMSQSQEDNGVKFPEITKNGGQKITEEEVKEFEQGFGKRERIVRSPEGTQKPSDISFYGSKKKQQTLKQGQKGQQDHRPQNNDL